MITKIHYWGYAVIISGTLAAMNPAALTTQHLLDRVLQGRAHHLLDQEQGLVYINQYVQNLTPERYLHLINSYVVADDFPFSQLYTALLIHQSYRTHSQRIQARYKMHKALLIGFFSIPLIMLATALMIVAKHCLLL